ncbi:Tex family protein [Velocimicrobium porci]|uniref:RNA-binding transcriptional accessory protein n=1 Tax=Velocimicrobium porci TaxID=2606634 RepID=A0A6L5XYB9_9FIRM|nr:Tex family protein [Velocimicrobium porci]MSS63805.1 RNA-binding transcriptional accessory protein [Velocimicrobium porci]
MDILKKIKDELSIELWQVEAVVKLIDEGNTIPFIARYRKEMHGALNDEQLRNLSERLTYLRNLEDKKAQVLASIEEQGKLTEELKKQILLAETQVVVEDLYRPYRPKRRTRATIAKEKGLNGLAEYIMKQEATEEVEQEASKYISEEKDVKSAKDAIAGAMDIIAEAISDEADHRIYIRKVTMEEGTISSTAKDEKQQSVYEMYYSYEEPIEKIAGHRILALNRGEKEKILVVKVNAPEERILRYLEKKVILNENPYTAPILSATIEDSYKRLIAPAIEREIRNDLTEQAEDGAIKVFGKNLEQLLMQPPIANQVVLGWDPAFRTGCKLAVVDSTGKVLDTTVIYPTDSPNKNIPEAKRIVKELIEKYGITLISIGNGTASRESELVVVEILKEIKQPVQYVITNEAGASVYSASKLATEEFPNFDVGQRSAASIARRVQDPLAELVKIDPKSIGVGQYQHDMNQKKLSEALSAVVEDSVNHVGVDLNTASAPLLEYVSGVSKAIAKNIVAYREENGKFTDRKQLLKVAKLGPKAFEQCAGFMRITDGENPLDATSVHPESYKAAEELLRALDWTMDDVRKVQAEAAKNKGKEKKQADVPKRKEKHKNIQVKQRNTAFGQALLQAMGDGIPDTESIQASNEVKKETVGSLGKRIKNKEKLAKDLQIGIMTLEDILKELEKPGRDPRDEMPKPILRTDVLEMKDLKEGMVLNGTVRNVIDFGAFIDIGVHQDGLVHISEMSNKKFVKHPLDVVSVGDIVEVKVMSVDLQKKRVQLTMKL